MKQALARILFAFLLSYSEDAHSYCGTTTCDATPGDQCGVDAEGCSTGGVSLVWPLDTPVTVICGRSCDDLVAEALNGAVRAWQGVLCDGETPRIAVIQQDEPRVDEARDVVLVEVVETAWPYGASAVGRTTVEFGSTSGTLLRATISLNAGNFVLGFATADDEVDVQAVLTHELGHALGLAHSSVSEATMQAEADVGYVSELSTLHEDDERGLCALYPPAPAGGGAGGEGGRPGTNGQTAGGCSMAEPGSATGVGWPLVLLLLAGRKRQGRGISSIPRPCWLVRSVSSTLRPAR